MKLVRDKTMYFETREKQPLGFSQDYLVNDDKHLY